MKNLFILSLVLLLIISSCIFDSEDNSPPRIISLTATPSSVAVNQNCTLSVNAYDPDGDKLNYHWESASGSFISGEYSKEAVWK